MGVVARSASRFRSRVRWMKPPGWGGAWKNPQRVPSSPSCAARSGNCGSPGSSSQTRKLRLQVLVQVAQDDAQVAQAIARVGAQRDQEGHVLQIQAGVLRGRRQLGHGVHRRLPVGIARTAGGAGGDPAAGGVEIAEADQQLDQQAAGQQILGGGGQRPLQRGARLAVLAGAGRQHAQVGQHLDVVRVRAGAPAPVAPGPRASQCPAPAAASAGRSRRATSRPRASLIISQAPRREALIPGLTPGVTPIQLATAPRRPCRPPC